MLELQIVQALKEGDAHAAKQRVRESLLDEKDARSVVRAFLVRAAHHDPLDRTRMDALVLATELARLLEIEPDISTSSLEFLITNFVEYLVEIPVETLDSEVLKPTSLRRTVAVQEVEEALITDDLERVHATLRDLLMVMDNKPYFIEILMGIALRKSPQSVLAVQSLAEAIDLMDWTHPFTPFLILHVSHVLWYDRATSSVHPAVPDPHMFETASGRVTTLSQLVYLSALWRLHNTAKILTGRLEPLMAGQLSHLPDMELGIGAGSGQTNRWINVLIFRSSMQTLSRFPSLVRLENQINS